MDIKTIWATLALLGSGLPLSACDDKKEAKEVDDKKADAEKADADKADADKADQAEMACGEGKCGAGACGANKDDGTNKEASPEAVPAKAEGGDEQAPAADEKTPEEQT